MKDGHDWYCFTCHSPGDLLLCSECFRAYHTNCTEEDYSGSKFTCSVCKVSSTVVSLGPGVRIVLLYFFYLSHFCSRMYLLNLHCNFYTLASSPDISSWSACRSPVAELDYHKAVPNTRHASLIALLVLLGTKLVSSLMTI